MQPALAPAPQPSMQSTAQDPADQVLHDQLVAAAHANSRPPPSSAHLQSSQDQNSNIDPAIAGGPLLAPNPHPAHATLPDPGLGIQSASAADPNASQDSRKSYGKRELSTSKRAAQNRAAQRAFRQRKEGYIRKLEEQVKDYNVLLESYKALQNENYQLREYIINLQSRLIDSQNEVPELPGNIDLTQPRPDPPSIATVPSNLTSTAGGASGTTPHPIAPRQQPDQPSAPPPTAGADEMSQLGRLAVAGLGMRKHNSNGSATLTFLGREAYSPRKRARMYDNADPIVKTETPIRLPML